MVGGRAGTGGSITLTPTTASAASGNPASAGPTALLGTIRPQGSATIDIDRTVKFTAAKAAKLASETPPAAALRTGAVGGWMWIALSIAAAAVISLMLVVWKLARRSVRSIG